MRTLLGKLAITAVVVASVGITGASGAAHAVDVATFHGLSPARLMDTRGGQPTIDGQFAGIGPVGNDSTVNVTVTGRGGVPATGAGSVALNVTVTAPTGNGYLTVFPAGATRPTASNLNFTTGKTVPNMVVVAVGSGGQVSIYNSSGSSHVIVDVLGWFPAVGAFTGVVPGRLLDSRTGFPTVDGQFSGTGALNANGEQLLVAAGRGGVPSAGVGAVALNVTVTSPVTNGYLTVYPTGATRPTASNLNFVSGQTVPNMVIVPLGSGGQVSVFNGSGGSLHLIVDVLGWFPSGSTFTGLTPTRLADTRIGSPTIDGKYSGYRAITNQAPFSLDPTVFNVIVAGRGGVPATDVGAVALNVTVTSPTAAGFLTVYPAGTHRPTASNLNFTPFQTVPNMVIVPLGNNGQISIYNSAGSADVIVDVLGWFPASTSPPTPYGNNLTLAHAALGSLPFGSSPTSVIALAQTVFGAPTADESEDFPTFSPGSNMYYNDASGDSFAFQSGREVCFGGQSRPFCVSFGGANAGALTFVGWAYYGDPEGLLFDSNAVGFGSRAADFPGAISYDPGGCINTGVGNTSSGIRLFVFSRGSDFATFINDTYVPLLPAAADVYVAGMNSGQYIIAEGDC